MTTEAKPKGDASIVEGLLVPEDAYAVDLALLDRYQGFSSEILRLSLAGIGVLGVLVNLGLRTNSLAVFASCVSVILLALAAAFALGHRYLATDGFAEQITTLRHAKTDAQEAAMDRGRWTSRLKSSARWLVAAALSLGLGAIFLAVAVIALLTAPDLIRHDGACP